MENMTIVAVDAMGGDNAPAEIVKGAVDAVKEKANLKVLLVGQEEAVKKELEACGNPGERIEIVPASQVIETGEPPVAAIRGKKDSSIVVGMKLVKKGGSRRFRIRRKLRSHPGGRDNHCGQDQRCRESASGSADPHKRRCVPLDRLRCQRGCPLFSSGTVCPHGFHLHGACYGCQKAPGGNREHRR